MVGIGSPDPEKPIRTLLIWSPRLLAILFALFLGIFAMDAVGQGPLAVLVHLIPSGLLLAVVALAWRWPCVGTAAFLVFALLIGAPTLARGGAPWLFCLPMLLISGLYFLAWRVK